MRKVLLPVYILAIFFYSNSFSSENKIRFIKINLSAKNQEEIRKLYDLKLDIAYQNKYEDYVDAFVNTNQMARIQELGFESETIIPDMRAFGQKLRDSNYFDSFYSYEEIVLEIHQLESNYPDIVKVQSIGQSWEGRDIWAVKISDNVSLEESNEAEALFMANIHAREMITPEIIMYFMHWLIDNYNIDPRATYLANNRQIWLIPTINPDGRVYVFTGDNNNTWSNGNPIAWRKNKRDNNNNNIFDYNYDGVDLNRNFGYMWGLDLGSSSDPWSEVYRGPYPFSEPESQAIKNFVEAHHFVTSLSYHSYGRWWIFPWGYTNINPDTPDHPQFVALAESCTVHNGYTPANGDDFSYLVSGDTDDWLHGEQITKNKIFAFTPEVGSPGEGYFWPDTSLILKLVEENLEPNIFMAFAAGEEPIIEHNPIRETESPDPYPIIAKIIPPIVLTSPVPLDESSYKLFYNTTGRAPFDSVFLLPTGNPDEYAAEISSIPLADTIHYYLSASDQNGRKGTMPRGAPMTTFAFRIGADWEPPKIHHTPFEYASIYADQIPIQALVTDNIGISIVKLLYRKNGSELDTLEMNPNLSLEMFQGIIVSENLMVGDTIEYKILAVDNSQNRNTTQLPETGYFSFYIKNCILYDFELDSIFTQTTEGDWQWGVPTSGPNSSHTGSKLWATNLSGNYSDLTESILETPEISLVDKDSAKLIFWHWYQNEFSEGKFWEGGNLKISVDDGPFQIIESESGYDGIADLYNTFIGNEPCFGGFNTGNFWHQEIVNLNDFIYHNIKIRFHFGSDGTVNDLGWYIDNVEIEFEAVTGIESKELANPFPISSFELYQNYPNPFNPETRIQYRLAQAGEVTLEIFNLLGEKVTRLVNEKHVAGNYMILWQSKDESNNEVSCGVYLYRLIVKGKNYKKIFVKKMVKLK